MRFVRAGGGRRAARGAFRRMPDRGPSSGAVAVVRETMEEPRGAGAIDGRAMRAPLER